MAKTHFGYQTVDEDDKAGRVRGVFDSVASNYDLMNDVLSMGMHRAWKAYTVAVAAVRPGMQVLDIAGGTGDLARAFAKAAGDTGQTRGDHEADGLDLVGVDAHDLCGDLILADCVDPLAKGRGDIAADGPYAENDKDKDPDRHPGQLDSVFHR